MNRLDLEKAEELEIKLSTFTRSERKQGNSRKTSVSASLTMLKPLTGQITTNWKILKEMGVPDHLTCLVRNLYVGQEATVRTRHGITDSFETVFLSLSIFNLYAENIMQNARLDDSPAIIKTAGRNNNLRYAADATLMAEGKEPLYEGDRGE